MNVFCRPGSLAAESLILSLGNSICDFVGAAAALPHQPSSPPAQQPSSPLQPRRTWMLWCDLTQSVVTYHQPPVCVTRGQGREVLVQLFNVQELPYVVRVKRSPIICSLSSSHCPSGIARCCVSARRQHGVSGPAWQLYSVAAPHMGGTRESGDQTGGDNTRPHTAHALTHMFGFYVELLNQNIMSSYQSYQLWRILTVFVDVFVSLPLTMAMSPEPRVQVWSPVSVRTRLGHYSNAGSVTPHVTRHTWPGTRGPARKHVDTNKMGPACLFWILFNYLLLDIWWICSRWNFIKKLLIWMNILVALCSHKPLTGC